MRKILLFCCLFIYGSVFSQNVYPPSGNVGIGTNNPQAALHIVRDVQANIALGGNDPYIFGGITFQDRGQTTAGKIGMWAIYAGRDGGSWASGLGFHRYDAVNACATGICDMPFFIHANGNVGVGTSEPGERLDVRGGVVAEKLSVNGNIRSRKVIVTQTGWSDYVFDPSYKLPSLDSVAAFVQENKHLPEVPSAATVIKEGLDVGEMQKLLLQKIEELTLYVIDLKKENKELRQRVEKVEVKK